MRNKGYAVIFPGGTLGLHSHNLEECKQYCRHKCKVVKVSEIINGFSIKIRTFPKPFRIKWDKYSGALILGIVYIYFHWLYREVYGQEVWRPE